MEADTSESNISKLAPENPILQMNVDQLTLQSKPGTQQADTGDDGEGV